MALIRAELQGVLLEHGMGFSSWDSGYPSIRAAARHPVRGLAVIECLSDQPPNFEVVAYHWFDDMARLVRCSRSTRFPRNEYNPAHLRAAAAAALRYLITPATHDDFESSPLASGTGDDTYEKNLNVLR
jgi:hypothetical protein